MMGETLLLRPELAALVSEPKWRLWRNAGSKTSAQLFNCKTSTSVRFSSSEVCSRDAASWIKSHLASGTRSQIGKQPGCSFLFNKKKKKYIKSKPTNVQKYLSRSLETLRKDKCLVGLLAPLPTKVFEFHRK